MVLKRCIPPRRRCKLAARNMLNCCSNRVWRIGHLPNASPQMLDALGGMRSGKSTALRGWMRCGITETLRALITLKRPQWSQRFQWSQWFSGHAQIDESVGEQAIEDWLRAIAIRPDDQDSLENGTH
jgi:hypothetical protein